MAAWLKLVEPRDDTCRTMNEAFFQDAERMKSSTLDKLIWVFIYGGLLCVGLGLSVGRSDNVLGWTVVIGGLLTAAVGALLVYVRSRRNDKT